MYLLWLVIMTLSQCVIVGGADIGYMKSSITSYFSDTRHHDPEYRDYKTRAKEYIYNEFVRFGLETEYHTFNDTNVSPTATFQNVIGILKGKNFGSVNDSLVGVGAHYDTVKTTKGVDDNGAGVAAMLDVIRQITDMNNRGTKRKNTIIFVSFDLEEYGGLSGSRHLLTTWAPNWLQKNYASTPNVIHGFIIMDTMMEFNTSAHSQVIPQGAEQIFQAIFPNASASIASDNFEGDFLNLIFRQNSPETNLAATFRTKWGKAGRNEYELEQFALPDQSGATPEQQMLLSQFLRSDHYNFWQNNLPAIFLTDSANFRGDMIQCYHSPCDDLDVMLTDDNINFLGKTADVITSTIHQLSDPTGPTSSAVSAYGMVGCIVPIIIVGRIVEAFHIVN